MRGNVIDVERPAIHARYTVLIEAGRILEVGPARAVTVPRDAEVIDCEGFWILPGLVDSHIHLFQSGGLYTRPDIIDLRRFRSYEQERAWVRANVGDLLARHLAAGVTTVVDLGGPISNYALREQFNRAQRSPEIFLTGPLVSTWQPPAPATDDPPIIRADDIEQARSLVRSQLPYRPDLIKIWYVVRGGATPATHLPIVRAAIEEAHSHGLKAAVHATQLETAKLAVGAGADVLVHGVDDSPVDREFGELLAQRRIPYIPTLLVSRRYDEVLSRRLRPSPHDFALANPFVLGTLTDLWHLDGGARVDATRGDDPASLAREAHRRSNLKVLARQGVLIATGTDAGNIGTPHGSAYFDELVAMREAGLGPWEILQASTINGAKALGKESDFGSIERGKRADLLVLGGDPVRDLGNVLGVRQVVHHGKVLEPASLIDASPAALVQRQVNAYNHRNLEAFLEPYDDAVQVRGADGALRYAGKARMRTTYERLFRDSPGLHCEIVERTTAGHVVTDRERVSGAAGKSFETVARYTIERGKIARVEFSEPSR